MKRLGAALALTLSWLLLVRTLAAAQSEGDPERGGQIYVENCAVCHGVDGKGRIGARLEAFSGIDPAAVIAQTVAQGIEGTVMPAWGEANGGPLSDQDIADVVAYVVAAFNGTEPIEPLPEYVPPEIPRLPDVEGDPSLGAVVYQANCFACHGEEGRGRIGASLAKSWPGGEPELFIRQVVSEGIEGTKMPAWAQTNGGPLSDDEIANVAAYLLTLTPGGSVAEPTTQPGPIGTSTVLLVVAGLIVLAAVIGIAYYRRA
jgi:mono/diheme cytochrome c family protein